MELSTQSRLIPNSETLLGLLEKVSPSELKAIGLDSAIEIAEVLETLPWARYSFASYVRQNRPEIGGWMAKIGGWMAILPDLESGLGV